MVEKKKESAGINRLLDATPESAGSAAEASALFLCLSGLPDAEVTEEGPRQ